MKKNITLFITKTLIILLAVVSVISLTFTPTIAADENAKIEFGLLDYELESSQVSIAHFIENADKYGDTYYYFLILSAKSLGLENIKLDGVDLNIQLSEPDVPFEIYDIYVDEYKAKVVDDRGREKEVKYWSRDIGVSDEEAYFTLTFDGEGEIDYQEIKQEPTYLVKIEIGIDASIFDKALDGFYIDLGFDIANSDHNDITYNKNGEAATQFLQDEVKLARFQVGNPSAGPSADLASIEIKTTGTSTVHEHVTKTEDIEPNKEITNITYQDSLKGLTINAVPVKLSATVVTTIKSGGITTTFSGDTGPIADGDEVYITITDGDLVKTYTRTFRVVDADDDSSVVFTTNFDQYANHVGFEESTNDYYIKVPYSINSLTVTMTPNSIFTTVEMPTGGKKTQELFVGVNDFGEFRVKTEAGTNQVYHVYVERLEGSDEKGFSVKIPLISENSIEKEGNTFNAILPELLNTFNIKFTKLHEKTTLYYYEGSTTSQDTSLYELLPSNNELSTQTLENKGDERIYTILAISETGETEISYIHVKREESSVAKISSIEFNETGEGLPIYTTVITSVSNEIIYNIERGNSSTLVVHPTTLEGGTSTFTDNDGNSVSNSISISDLQFGENIFKITVLPKNGDEASVVTYTLKIYKRSSEKELESILLQRSGSSNPEVYRNENETKSYTIFLDYETHMDYKVVLTSSPNSYIEINTDQGGAIKQRQREVYFKFTGTNESSYRFVYRIYAEDKSHTEEFFVEVIRRSADGNADLESISIDGTIISGFSKDKFIYDHTISRFASGSGSIQIQAEASSDVATVRYYVQTTEQLNGIVGLNNGTPITIRVVVTAQNGTTKTYEVRVVAGNTENDITSITLTNPSTPFAFDKSKEDFYVTLPYSVSGITINATASPYATIVGAEFKGVPANETVVAEVYAISESGIKGKVYRIHITREEAKIINDLDSLQVSPNDQGTTGLPKEIVTHNLTYTREVTSIRVVATIKSEDRSRFENTQGTTYNVVHTLNPGDNKIMINVISESGDIKTYTINIKIADSNNNLVEFKVGSDVYLPESFDSSKTLVLPDILFSQNVLNLVITKQNPHSVVSFEGLTSKNITTTYNWINLQAGDNVFTFTITSENGDNSTTYTVKVKKLSPNKENSLAGLEILLNGTDLIQTLDDFVLNETTNISLRVDRGVEKVTIKAYILASDRSKVLRLGGGVTDGDYIIYTYDLVLTGRQGDLSTVDFTVQAEDVNFERNFTVRILSKNANNDVDELIIKQGEDIVYQGDFDDVELSSEFSYNVQSLTFYVYKNDGYARLFVENVLTGTVGEQLVTFNSTLKTGLNTIKLRIDSEVTSNESAKDYQTKSITITYTKKAASTVAELDTLTVTYGGGIELFKYESGSTIPFIIRNSENKNYNIIREYETINIIATAKDGGTVTGAGNNKILVDANGTSFKLIVKAENGNEQEYHFTITNKNIDNEIEDITIDGVSIGFDKEVYAYDLTANVYPYTKKTIEIEAIADTYATLTGVGTITLDYNLVDGINVFTVYATSELGVKGKAYVITIKIEKPYKIIDLNDLVVVDDNDQVLSFTNNYQAGTYEYTIDLEPTAQLSNVKVFAELLNDEKQQIDITYGQVFTITFESNGTINKVITFTVTAEDNASKTYTITIKKGIVLSDENDIFDISFAEYAFEFNQSEKTYEFTVPYAVSKLTATVLASDKATISGNKVWNLEVGKETLITIFAVSEKGTKGDDYILRVTRDLPSSMSKLDEIYITLSDNINHFIFGNESRDLQSLNQVHFDANTGNYTINLGIEYARKVIYVTAVKGHSGQVLQYFSLSQISNLQTLSLKQGANEFQIFVMAEDGTSSFAYSITINVKNTENDLSELKLNNEFIDLLESELNYETEQEFVDITYKMVHDSGSVKLFNGLTQVTNKMNLEFGDNLLFIEVYNDYSELVNAYTITITRNKSSNKDITSVTLKDVSGTNYIAWHKDTLEYTITVPSSVSTLTLAVVPSSPKANVYGNGTYEIKLDDVTSISFYVEAEDGLTTATYQISVLRQSLSTNVYLKEIAFRYNANYLFGLSTRNPLSGVEYIYDQDEQVINLGYEYVGRTIIVEDQKNHNNQEVTYIGLTGKTLTLQYGRNEFSIDVKAEDRSVDPFTYTIVIHVKHKTNDLESLKVNNEVVAFDTTTPEIYYETESTTISLDYKALNNGNIVVKNINNDIVKSNIALEYGDNIFTMLVYNEFEDLYKEYRLTIKRLESSDNSIEEVTLFGSDHINYLSFNETTYTYIIEVPYFVEEVTLSVMKRHALAQTYIGSELTSNKVFQLTSGMVEDIEFSVVAENGDTVTYNIEVVRLLNTENKLKDLTVETNIDTLIDSTIFDADTLYYYFEVTEEHQTLRMQFEANFGQIVKGLGFEINEVLPIQHGLNTFIIEVYPEDDSIDTIQYVIDIEMINQNADIDEIIVNGENIYVNGKNEYTLNPVSSEVQSITLEVLAKDNYADVEVLVNGVKIQDNNVVLQTGNNTISVQITSENGQNISEVIINIEQLLNTYDLFDELSVITNESTYLLGSPDKAAVITFDPEVFTYTLEVNEDVIWIKLDYVLGNAKQSFVGDFNKQLTINHGMNSFEVWVYPEDTSLPGQKYAIQVNQIYKDIDLSELKVNGKSIYDEYTQDYMLDAVTTDVSKITLLPELTNIYGQYEIIDAKGNVITNNEVPLYFGENIISINLVSESGETTRTYTVKIHQTLSSANEITKVEVVDLMTNLNKIIFDKNTHTYNVTLNHTSDKARLIVEASPKAKIFIDGHEVALGKKDYSLAQGENKVISFYIEAEDGSLTDTYEIHVYRRTEDEGGLSDNNILSDLKVELPINSNTINFDPSIYTYYVTVPYSASEVYLKGYPEHPGATVYNEGAYALEVGQNDPIYIRVQAEDGTPSRYQYTVIFTRELPNSDTTLSDLKLYDLQGNLLNFDQKVFNPDNYVYSISLGKDASINQVRVVAEKNNETQTIFGTGVVSLHGEVEGQYNTILPVTVVAEDGTSKDYLIYVLHELDFSNLIEIKDISIIGDDNISYFGREFASDIYEYEVYVPFNVSDLRLIVQTFGNVIYLDEFGSEIDENRLQSFDDNDLIIYRFKIQSINEQNYSLPYEIKVIREKADDNVFLENLMIDGKTIPNFDKHINNYVYVQYILDPNFVNVFAKAESDSSVVNGNNTYALIEGDSIYISIIVTAQNKSTNTYTVEVKYVDSNALLKELAVYEIDEFGNEFVRQVALIEGEFNYTVQIDKDIKVINILGSAMDQKSARLRGFGQYNVNEADLTVPITVTSGDGSEERVYFVTVTKNLRGNAKLRSIEINGRSIENFDSDTLVYDAEISSDTGIVTISAEARDNNATIFFNGKTYDNNQFTQNDLQPGQTSIIIKVVSESGEVIETYVVNLAKAYQPDLLLTILLIVSLLLWIFTILVTIIKKTRKGKSHDHQDQLIF